MLFHLCTAPDIAGVARVYAAGVAASRSVALARVWTAHPGAVDLTLAGSAGTPSGGGGYTRLDGSFSRVPIGGGKIGRIAATEQPFIVRSLRGDEDWLANPTWVARQGVRAFVGLPLLAQTELVGVFALFDRHIPTDADLDGLALLADVAAARIFDLRGRATARATASTDAPRLSEEPLPRTDESPVGISMPIDTARSPMTRDELRRLERDNIVAALAHTRGRIFGPHGAAALLGMRPTTLASRIKALGIDRRTID